MKIASNSSAKPLKPYYSDRLSETALITLGTTGTTDDSDNDGLLDTWEIKYFGDLRYGLVDDPDGDRLKNKDEFTYGTDPTKKDSDGDGFSDMTEITLGSDPLAPLSKPIDLGIFVHSVDVEFNTVFGHSYQLQASSDLLNWLNLGDLIIGNDSLFRTNIDVRGTDYRFFRVPHPKP